MDSALLLKINEDNLSEEIILSELAKSKIVQKLTQEFEEKPLYAIWRIVALAEIPYAEKLEYTHKVVEYIKTNLFAEEGFSYTGKIDDIVPCYNAMIIEAFSKLGEQNCYEVRKAVQWIENFQFFHRGDKTKWKGKGIHRHGGCLNYTPCYIGLAKTLKALIYYKKTIQIVNDYKLNEIIDEASIYVRQHHFCYRKSTGKPMSKHILDPAFPPSYVLNIVELLELAYLTDSIHSIFAEKMVSYIKSIQNDNRSWGVGYQYKSDGYISFDGSKKNAEWITVNINKYLNGV